LVFSLVVFCLVRVRFVVVILTSMILKVIDCPLKIVLHDEM
jgi:hypothetical protein